MKKVAIVMGSANDAPKLKPAADKLRALGIPFDVRVLSAHRTPRETIAFSVHAAENGYGVIIAAAGMAAHLAGVIAANTILPVIGIPLSAACLDGLDALLATVQMPGGIPVATVAINGAVNAAVLAAQMLAIADTAVAARLEDMRIEMTQDVLTKDLEIQKDF